LTTSKDNIFNPTKQEKLEESPPEEEAAAK